MENKYIDAERISIDFVVSELYDLSKIGALSIPGVLSSKARENIVKGAKSAIKLFWKAPRVEGPVIQEMETLYIEDTDVRDLERSFVDSIKQFKREYGEIYRQISKKAGFLVDSFNSVGIHYYPYNSQGITPHRDYTRDRDLISIFVLQGQAKFCVCEDRNKKGSINLDSSSGSLILLRAARNDLEQSYRPFHYVEPIERERFSLIVRRILR
ncbi:MAG: hypothetical protein IIA85_01130 [Nanoarchaeota archaeon]|nr:hypothetical protein [Nanoarchaeota archaeon]